MDNVKMLEALMQEDRNTASEVFISFGPLEMKSVSAMISRGSWRVHP